MKKSLLLFVAVVFGIAAIGQNHALKPNLKTANAININKIAQEPTNAYTLGQAKHLQTPNHNYKNTDFVSIISIGTAANAYGYGYAGGQRNIVDVNNDLNSVTNFHRMGGVLDPGGYSGDLGYDISVDGGMTFTNMVECYVATENQGGTYYADAARYPNHGVYNPAGNTDPNEAYVTFFAPNLDGSNGGSWGGYSYGRAKIGDPTDTTKHLLSTHDDFYQLIPDGFCITSLGEVWATDVNYNATTNAYEGSIIMNHGVWSEEENDFVYEEYLLPLDILSSWPIQPKIEFAPDGLTGYLVVLADNGDVPISTNTSYYPIMFKTTDGGESWSDPMAIALAGEDGIGGVEWFLSDDELAELYEPPVPDREEIPFTTAFDFDLSVDAWGNPAIAVVVGITGSDPYTIITAQSEITGYQFTAAFLITSTDGGESFIGYNLGRQKTFRGTFGDLTEDNRIQIARTPGADKMFVSWLDTDLPGVTDNNQPDIWARGIDIVNHTLTADQNGEDLPNNVTEFSEAMWQSYFFAMGNEVLQNDATYTIPYAYEDMNPEDPGQEVQFKYIQDFAYTNADFMFTGINNHASEALTFEVSQNFPNPAAGNTTVAVTLQENTTVSFEIVNAMGQKVYEVPAQQYSAGVQTFNFDASDFSNGVYFYTVKAGEKQITKKMIVK